MAKKKGFENVAEGFFIASKTQQPNPVEKEIVNEPVLEQVPEEIKVEQKIKEGQPMEKQTKTMIEKKTGRPRAGDLKPDEELYKTTIHFTDETLDMIDTWRVKNGRMDRSEAVRRAVRMMVNKQDYGV